MSSPSAEEKDRGLEQLPCRQAEGDLIAAFQYLKGDYKKEGNQLFTQVDSDRTRGNGFKLKEGRFRLDVRGKFFIGRVVRCWNRLPRGVVDALSLEIFKARLDGPWAAELVRVTSPLQRLGTGRA